MFRGKCACLKPKNASVIDVMLSLFGHETEILFSIKLFVILVPINCTKALRFVTHCTHSETYSRRCQVALRHRKLGDDYESIRLVAPIGGAHDYKIPVREFGNHVL
jgi:hypothetical protein